MVTLCLLDSSFLQRPNSYKLDLGTGLFLFFLSNKGKGMHIHSAKELLFHYLMALNSKSRYIFFFNWVSSKRVNKLLLAKTKK